MANCVRCGVALSPGPQIPHLMCSHCAVPPQQPAPVAVITNEYRDAHEVVEFKLHAGQAVEPSPMPYWRAWQKHPHEALVIREMRATVVGGSEDVGAVIGNITARLEDESHRPLFERPLGILAISEKTRDAETEERLVRLERMMNVLVEQDSPAGEALRRLGGTKIEFQSPTVFAKAVLFNRGHGYCVSLILHDRISLSGDVSVRISLFGLSKNPVA